MRSVQGFCDLCGSHTSLHRVIQDNENSRKDTIRCCPGCLARYGLSADSVGMNLGDFPPHRGVKWGRKRGRKR